MALQVHRDDGIKLVLGHVEDHPFAEVAGNAHHAVDASPSVHCGPDYVCARLEGRNVPRHRQSGSPGGDDLLDNGVGYFARWIGPVHGNAIVGNHDSGPGRCASHGHGATDAVAAAGDHDVLALQHCPHGSISLVD